MLFLFALMVAAGPTPPEFFAGNDELRAYQLEAAQNAPALRARHAEWRAALERIPQATSLDDPQLTYTQFVQSDTSYYRVGLMQMFPWFGTLKARGDQAAAEAEAALMRFYDERNRVFNMVREAYYDYAFLGESMGVTESQAALLKEMEEVTSTRYSLGLASEADLLRVQTEQSELEDVFAMYQQQRPVVSARLSVALGRDTSEVLPWPQATALPPPPPPAPIVLARVKVANPSLTALDHLLRSRDQAIALARKRGRPNLTVGLEYEDMRSMSKEPPDWPYMSAVEGTRALLNGDPAMLNDVVSNSLNQAIAYELMPGPANPKDDVMVSIGVNVPIWRKKVRAGIAEAREMRRAVEFDKHERSLALEVEARQALFEVQDGLRRHRLYTEVLIPKGRQTYESLRNRYSTGDSGASFLDVLEAERVLLTYRIEALRALRDVQVGASRLEMLMGGPWTAAESEKLPQAPQPPAELGVEYLPTTLPTPPEAEPAPLPETSEPSPPGERIDGGAIPEVPALLVPPAP